MAYVIDESLREFALNDEQWEKYVLSCKHGSNAQAAKHSKYSRSAIQRAKAAIEKNAARHGVHAEIHRPAPPGFVVKGTSTLYDVQTGDAKVQWVKTDADKEAEFERWGEAIDAYFDDARQIKVPKFDIPKPNKDIVPWFQIGDAHLGAVAWMRELGHNFDLQIGAAEIVEAFDYLLEQCEPCERCVINDLGDGTHYENFKAETERGGFKLDADGRFPKMLDVYIHVFLGLIKKALTKFKHVDVIINQGNHSRTNDMWMARLVAATFKDTGRVHVVPNENVFIPYLMGKTFVMTHHSDKAQGRKLADVMLNDYREALKQAEFFYIDTGHVHHRYVAKEYGLIEIESWNNLAPNDKHHHDGGWRSKQSMSLVKRSRTYGELGRARVPIQLIWDRLQRAGDKPTSMPDREIYTV